MAGKHGLGRGFESLIPTGLIDDSFDPNSSFDPTAKQDASVSRYVNMQLANVKPDANQPRRHFDAEALNELAASIKEHGLIQPIIVAPVDEDNYQIIAGERRYRAAVKAGLKNIPVVVRKVSDQNRLELALVENIQRRDLNAIETATAYAKLRDQFNLSNEQIAERVHKSASAVVNTMRLLRLPPEVITALADGKLREGQVRPLVGQNEELIKQILPRIIAEEWSARKVEQYVSRLKEISSKKKQPKVPLAANNFNREAVVSKLQSRLSTSVNVSVGNRGSGKIIIAFKDSADLERIEKLLGSS